ncbi:type VII secretion system-associated protein [Streptomyces chartreusis]|uniref:type VII secretion system-associated protein n=1 Tax=Streptomyces chartreusis TaxID=1969 RepID=UPI002F91B6C7|nr:type VII secretion system-associated protein [Streptomyces chartreusis]WTA33380.1 type VII secretion system-associated protein [Streptomyces chartreusis]
MAEDPNTKTGKLSMDKAGLQAFLDDRVELFQDELRKIALDDPNLGQTMGTLLGETKYTTTEQFNSYGLSKPLRLGIMLKPEHLHGKGEGLNKAIAKTADDLTAIYEEQTKLFGDVADNLKTTIEKLLSSQNENLTKIDGQEFLDIFEDVNSDLNGGKSGGGGEKEGED